MVRILVPIQVCAKGTLLNSSGPKGKHTKMNFKAINDQHPAGIMPPHCNIEVLPMQLSLHNEMSDGAIFLLHR